MAFWRNLLVPSSSDFLTLQMGLTCCPETSVRIFYSMLHNILKLTGLIYLAVETWNHVFYYPILLTLFWWTTGLTFTWRYILDVCRFVLLRLCCIPVPVSVFLCVFIVSIVLLITCEWVYCAVYFTILVLVWRLQSPGMCAM